MKKAKQMKHRAVKAEKENHLKLNMSDTETLRELTPSQRRVISAMQSEIRQDMQLYNAMLDAAETYESAVDKRLERMNSFISNGLDQQRAVKKTRKSGVKRVKNAKSKKSPKKTKAKSRKK